MEGARRGTQEQVLPSPAGPCRPAKPQEHALQPATRGCAVRGTSDVPAAAGCRPWVGTTAFDLLFLLRGWRVRNLSGAGWQGRAGASSTMEGARRGTQDAVFAVPRMALPSGPTTGTRSTDSHEGLRRSRDLRRTGGLQVPTMGRHYLGLPRGAAPFAGPPTHQPQPCADHTAACKKNAAVPSGTAAHVRRTTVAAKAYASTSSSL